ncbi:flotillin-2 [Halyomorpha halys]|uniref:flotillin-2 n=1 Tax=Halyomorpha halys TaxID=286706 RepID=UPI0006D4E77F|nr:flotillin-2 [Halyomorpha halys]
MGNVTAVGPNEALIVTGGWRYPRKKIIARGGFVWTWYVGNKVKKMSLALMTLTPICEQAETSEGVPLMVSGIAHCKISSQLDLLKLAAEQFLDRSTKQIADAIELTLEGHLRAILSCLTVEEVYKDRVKFSNAVREIAATDLAKMGIEIVTFAIRDIYDRVNYLSSIGKKQIALVKRDANIGVVEADRDAVMKESQCERSAMAAKYDSYTKIAKNFSKYKLQSMSYAIEVSKAKAVANLAYELQVAKMQQRIRKEELEIDVIGKRKEVEIEAHEIERKEMELNAEVRLSIDADIYSRKMNGQGNNYRIRQIAMGESAKATSIGLAQAYNLEIIEKAKAERNKMRALVLQKYEDAAITKLFLDALPKIASAVCAPLAKTGDIVLLSNKDQIKWMSSHQ